MTANQSARNVRLFIGGKDFTPCMISFQGSDSHLDSSGLISFTGSILLGNAIDFDESLDDRKNPTRFCRGVQVTLEVANSTGVLQRHPRGALRILTPKYDIEKQQLTLEVGDLIAVLNFKEPTDPDKADNKSSEGKPASYIITNLLQEAGITNISGNIASTIYNYPLNLSGSYLQSVGKLLYANNSYAWIDRYESFRIEPANIAPSIGSISMLIGRDEIWYKRLEGAESPCEIIKAVGTEMIVRPTPEYIEDTTEQYGLASTVDSTASNFDIVIKRTKRIQEWSKSQHIQKVTSLINAPMGLVIPKDLQSKNSSKLSLIRAEEQVEEWKYEQNAECKLKTKETKIYQPRATYFAEFLKARPDYIADISAFNLTKLIKETYEYDKKDRLKKITVDTYELRIIILNGTDEDWKKWIFPPEYLVKSGLKTEEWTELNKNTWKYSTNSYEPLVRVNPDLANESPDGIFTTKSNLVYAAGETKVSNSGQLVPPAPERCPPEYTIEENNIEEKAIFSDLCANNLKQRERTYTVDFLAGRVEPALRPGEVVVYAIGGGASSQASAQLQALAQREGRLLQGRYKGQELAMPLVDEIFNYSPLMTVRATEPDNTMQVYLADGASWVVSQMKALWSCDGIWVGTQVGGAVVPPYVEPKTLYLGQGQGIDFYPYPYLLATTYQQIELGQGQGLEASQLTWENFDWDSVDENTWNILGSSN
ncbi:hypothetical protein [Iningainema tapete]|uniref:Uncharacterized protein n=1 Tax=Iningainema tapete BLCC-T55 TaxID=2748662 RepID=A0A8J7C498_9CYAN|nr:hypothetical protein [Iningainema tapete]MBD2771179.1 hypothetical protein [Iningainema tapete BLCC-T55]